jgi:hypothetical protein
VEGEDNNAPILIHDLNIEYILPFSISHSIKRLWLQFPSLSIRPKFFRRCHVHDNNLVQHSIKLSAVPVGMDGTSHITTANFK